MESLKSCMQTVRVKEDGCPDWELREAMRPVCPVNPPAGHAYLWLGSDGSLTYFYDGGDVTRILANGDVWNWVRKPTILDAFAMPRNSSIYVEFKTDGSVETQWEGRERVFWGPDEPATEVAPTNGLRLVQLETQDETDEVASKEILEVGCDCQKASCLTCNAPVLDPDCYVSEDDASEYGGMCDCICCR